MQNYVAINFCERFCTRCCIWPTIVKKPTISGKIVGFLKFVREIQQLVQKRSKKNYIRYLVKMILAVYLIFYKLIFFESLIIFPEATTKSVTGIFDLQK